jgi:hypothetical protein
MTLASPVFKAILHKDALRSCVDRSSIGKAELSLPDDDPACLTILLDIIHGRTSKVPRRVSEDDLLKLAILVDKYEMHKVVGIFSDSWVESWKLVNGPAPLKGIVIFRHMSIFWVFGKDAEFKKTTEYAMQECLDGFGGHPTVNSLPIPKSVFGKYFHA